MEQKGFWTIVGVLLLSKFEFAPFRGKVQGAFPNVM